MLPTLNIGPLVIPSGGLIYILGAWLALTAVERAAKLLKLDVPATYGVAVTALVAGFVGARLIFVLTHWTAYAENPLGIVWPLTTGFNPLGGLLIGLAAGVYYGRWKQLPLAETLDALAPGIITALMTLSLVDFLAGPGYGHETMMPWGIDLFGIRRHPVQIYEMIAGILALFVWWATVRRSLNPGRPFLFSSAAYVAGRLLFDAFRADSPLTTGGYHLVQIASLLILIICLLLLARDGSAPVSEHEQPDSLSSP